MAEPDRELAWLSAQVPKDLKDAIEQLAEQHDRSLSAEVRQAVRAHVDTHHRSNGAAA